MMATTTETGNAVRLDSRAPGGPIETRWERAKFDLKLVNPAILAYNKAAECDLQDAKALERLGWIYVDKMLYEAATDRWQKAVARDPSRQDLVQNIAAIKAYTDSTGTR